MTYLENLKREHAAELQRYNNGLAVLHAENERLKAELRFLRGTLAQTQQRGGRVEALGHEADRLIGGPGGGALPGSEMLARRA